MLSCYHPHFIPLRPRMPDTALTPCLSSQQRSGICVAAPWSSSRSCPFFIGKQNAFLEFPTQWPPMPFFSWVRAHDWSNPQAESNEIMSGLGKPRLSRRGYGESQAIPQSQCCSVSEKEFPKLLDNNLVFLLSLTFSSQIVLLASPSHSIIKYLLHLGPLLFPRHLGED